MLEGRSVNHLKFDFRRFSWLLNAIYTSVSQNVSDWAEASQIGASVGVDRLQWHLVCFRDYCSPQAL